MLDLAVRNGAILWHGERVMQLDAGAPGPGITTASGMRVSAQAVVVTAGPWIARQLLPELAPWLSPCRIPIYWFAPRRGQEAAFRHQRFPLFLYQFDDGALLYGIPAGMPGEAGVKIGFHNRQHVPADPDAPPPGPVPAAYLDQIGQRVSSLFPGLAPTPVNSKWCWYTMSADESFLLGQSERHPAVYFASACSGHGFKFAPAIGQTLAAIAQGQRPPVDIDDYSPRRLARST
jgi:sarcosine oxidase